MIDIIEQLIPTLKSFNLTLIIKHIFSSGNITFGKIYIEDSKTNPQFQNPEVWNAENSLKPP